MSLREMISRKLIIAQVLVQSPVFEMGNYQVALPAGVPRVLRDKPLAALQGGASQ